MEKLDKLNYDTVILGGNLEALLHAYRDGLPLLMVNPQLPFLLDTTDSGLNKNLFWRKISYYLSYVGLNPLEQKISSYRIDEDNKIITFFGKKTYKVEVTYNNLINYDIQSESDKFRVLDYINIYNLRLEHQELIKNINTNSNFIKLFYTGITGKITDIVAVSYLDSRELAMQEYSEAYARLKTMDVLKQNGITGFIEICPDGRHRLHKIKSKTLKREIFKDTHQQDNLLLSTQINTTCRKLQKVVDIFGDPYAI